MTVWSSASISAIETSRQRWAMCRGSDWSKNSRLPYFCVLSSLGKEPSCSSRPSSRWLATSFCCDKVSSDVKGPSTTPYLFQRHTVLDEQCYPRVKIADVLLEHEVFLRLRGDFRLELSQDLLGCGLLDCVQCSRHRRTYLWPDRLQSPRPCLLRTWTDTAL